MRETVSVTSPVHSSYKTHAIEISNHNRNIYKKYEIQNLG